MAYRFHSRARRLPGRALRFATLLFAGLSFASVAVAEPTFPALVQKDANMPCTPACVLCHTTNPGVRASATKLFIVTLESHGWVPGPDTGTLNTAIQNIKMSATPVDTDGDGVSDYDELQRGTDPSDPSKDTSVCGPSYGCGAHVAKAAPSDALSPLWLMLAGAGLGVLLRRRRAG